MVNVASYAYVINSVYISYLLQGSDDKVVQVALGRWHSLVLTASGVVYGFGWGRFGMWRKQHYGISIRQCTYVNLLLNNKYNKHNFLKFPSVNIKINFFL